MLRRLNYTSRKRVPLENARVTVTESKEVLAFETTLKLDGHGLPSGARVFVEAYRRMEWMRFDFGTVGAITAPVDRRLTRFESPNGILFRIRIVSPDGTPAGKLLAEADRIRPVTSERKNQDRRTLLPLQPVSLDGELFRLDLTNDPVLLVERTLGDYWESTASSPVFQALVYPNVFRQVLATLVDQWPDDDDVDGWQADWAAMARSIPGFEPPPPANEEESTKAAWIDARVSAFARSHRLLDLFNTAWTEGGKN